MENKAETWKILFQLACIAFVIFMFGGATGVAYNKHKNNEKQKEKDFYESIHVENPINPIGVIDYAALESYLTKRDSCLKIGGTMNRVGEFGMSMNNGQIQWQGVSDHCEVGTTTKEWGTVTAEKRGWK